MSAQHTRSGLDFVNVLNETWVTFVRDLSQYGWEREGSGWEACSPSGEICVFETEREARVWRGERCRRSLASRLKLRINAQYGREVALGYEGGEVYFNSASDPSFLKPIVYDVNTLHPYPVELQGAP